MPRQWSQERYVAAPKYAAAALSGQKVPGSDLPYVVHVVMVAMEVRDVGIRYTESNLFDFSL
jgi:(p)ppGpp synthase/HD superfamily hydrolase